MLAFCAKGGIDMGELSWRSAMPKAFGSQGLIQTKVEDGNAAVYWCQKASI